MWRNYNEINNFEEQKVGECHLCVRVRAVLVGKDQAGVSFVNLKVTSDRESLLTPVWQRARGREGRTNYVREGLKIEKKNWKFPRLGRNKLKLFITFLAFSVYFWIIIIFKKCAFNYFFTLMSSMSGSQVFYLATSEDRIKGGETAVVTPTCRLSFKEKWKV